MADDEYPVGIFASEFSGHEPFLADHVIKERKILPGVVYLEMARAAVANSAVVKDGQMIVLSDSVFMQPMIAASRCQVETKVYPGAAGEFGIEVRTEQGVHFQSKAHIQSREEDGGHATAPPRVDISAWEEKCPKPGPTPRQFYANFAKKGINLGPSLRGIESFRLGEGCALVTVSLPGSSGLGMALNPGGFDSFIQSGDVIAADPERVRLPFAVTKTRIYGSLTDRMRGYIVQTEKGVDYTIADEQGHVIVIINGFIGREADAQQDQLLVYRPVWRETADLDDAPAAAKTTVLAAQDTYSALVKALCDASRNLIREKAAEHVLEVRLPEDKQAYRGIIAALKTVALEYPGIRGRLTIGGRSHGIAYQPLDFAKAPPYSWPAGKTILITGGLGGMGRIFARDIAGTSRGCTLILAGRSDPDPGKDLFLAELAALGAEAIYEKCDVGNRAEVDRLVGKYPALAAVIHGAGTSRDALLINKNPGDIDPVLDPKVNGIRNLDEATAHLELDYFVAFSSIAGTLGNAGQADYAAANGYMDAYIRVRAQAVKDKKRHGRSISINWPLWDSDGMQLDAATRENLLQVFRIRPLPPETGLRALKQAIASQEEQLVMLYGNGKALDAMMERQGSGAKRPARKAGQDESGKLVREILKEMRMQTAEHLKLKPGQLNDTADWAGFGFDSILLASFANRLNERFDLNLMPSVFFEATNIRLFGEYLAQHHPDQMAAKLLGVREEKPGSAGKAGREAPAERKQGAGSFANGFRKAYRAGSGYREKDVAVVGMSCRIAGAKTLDEFWNVLAAERDMISEIPRERWDWRDFPGVNKWGSFIDGVAEFDSLFFGVSPVEALYMTPEQRLLMQYVWECLEHAGCCGDDIKGTNTGLFIGCGPSSYPYQLRDLPIEAYSNTGYVPSVGPNRISYFMDWHGPSNPIDTACSSALVAVHRGVQAIHAGHCDQVIAGGVNLLLSPESYISFSKAGMLCEDGRCKTFSAQANGYARGEGIGLLMLKPLRKAIQDGNVIHALVKGTAENHGGRTNSLTAPNPKSQAAVIKQAVSEAGIDFGRISYIECHGTGTGLGDPVEIQGLKSVTAELLGDKAIPDSCKLGSIKSNIGHLEYAAGAVGLIKVILQMKHGRIAKSLHCDSINPYIDLRGTPFQIAQEAGEWAVEAGRTRVAGVSSFGFGGVNSHVILEEYLEDPPPDGEREDRDGRSALLVLSARNEEELMDHVARFPGFLQTLPRTPSTLRSIAYTLQTGRSEMPERLAFVADSIDEWSGQLDAFLRGKGGAGGRILRGSVSGNAANGLELADTKAGVEFIKQLIADNEAEKLGELWVKGMKIDWRALYA